MHPIKYSEDFLNEDFMSGVEGETNSGGYYFMNPNHLKAYEVLKEEELQDIHQKDGF